MPETEIRFSGVDNVTPELKKMGPAMQNLLKQAFSEGEKFTNNAKDLLKYAKERLAIVQQIKLANVQDKIVSAPGELKKQLEELKKQKEEYKKLAAQAIPGSKEQKEYQEKYKSIRAEEGKLPGKIEEQVRIWQEELKEQKQQSQLLKLIWMSLEMNAKKELVADEKNSKDLLNKFSKGEYAPKDQETKIKLLSQQAIVDQQKKEAEAKPSFWKDVKKVAAGMIIGEGVIGTLKSIASIPGSAAKGILGVQAGEEAPAAVLKSLENLSIFGVNIGFGAGIMADAISRHIEEKTKSEIAGFKIKGTMGYGGAVTGASIYGLDSEAASGIVEAYIKARGTGQAGKGYVGEAFDIIKLMKGLNLSQETLFGSTKLSRYSDQEVMQSTVRLISLLRSSGGLQQISKGLYDNTKVEEWIQALTELGTSQLQTLEKIDQSKNAQILSAFSTIWADPKQAAERLKSVDASLKSPSNDYQKALNFAVLASKNKGAGLFDLLELQEQGVSAPGLLQGRMDLMRKMYGSGDMLKLSTMNAFGLTAAQSRTMVEGYLANPKAFDYTQYTDKGLFKESQLEANTSAKTKQIAEISDAYITSAVDGLKITIKQSFDAIGKSLIDEILNLKEKIRATDN